MAVAVGGPSPCPRGMWGAAPTTPRCCWEVWGGAVGDGGETPAQTDGAFLVAMVTQLGSQALRLPWEQHSRGEKATSCRGQKRLDLPRRGSGAASGGAWIRPWVMGKE